MDRPHLRPVGINDFVRWSQEDSLILSPKFQRRGVWPAKARAFLIDTILRGLPIPKLYMRQHLDMRSSKTIHEVVDGQQRLQAVLDFRNDKFSLSTDDDFEYSGMNFSQLPTEAKRTFLTYEFSVDLLINALDADVLNIFARINSYAVPLNAQEKRNAKFFGSFKNTVYKLGFDHLEFWKKHRILSDKVIARMREAELTSELVIGMTVGLQDKKNSLDTFYKRWDDRFPYKARSVERFEDIIDLLEKHVGQLLNNTRFHRPALFYSLFLAVYEIRYGRLGNLTSARRVIGEKEGARIRRAVERLDAILGMSAPPATYQEFVTACQRQTDNIGPRRTRLNSLTTEFGRAS